MMTDVGVLVKMIENPEEFGEAFTIFKRLVEHDGLINVVGGVTVAVSEFGVQAGLVSG